MSKRKPVFPPLYYLGMWVRHRAIRVYIAMHEMAPRAGIYRQRSEIRGARMKILKNYSLLTSDRESQPISHVIILKVRTVFGITTIRKPPSS